MINNQFEYDKDFYAWALNSAKLIRAGNFSAIDLEHVAEEIEDMGKRNKRELISRLAILIAHFLKWRLQPEFRGHSWRYTIRTQRFEIEYILNESPSLKHEIEKQLHQAYTLALLTAIKETGLPKNTFPEICPYSLKECLDDEFFPE